MMRLTQKFIVALCSILLAFFLIALICFAYHYTGSFADNILIAQLIVFALAVCSTIIYNVMPLNRKISGLTHDVTKIVLLSETNVPINEFSLVERTSALICKNDSVYISGESELDADEHAVVNRVEKCWYLELVSDTQSMGLKRAGDQYIYKLKPGTCYKINVNDMIFIENERILIL